MMERFFFFLIFKQIVFQKRMNGWDCWGPDDRLDTKIDQIDLCHIAREQRSESACYRKFWELPRPFPVGGLFYFFAKVYFKWISSWKKHFQYKGWLYVIKNFTESVVFSYSIRGNKCQVGQSVGTSPCLHSETFSKKWLVKKQQDKNNLGKNKNEVKSFWLFVPPPLYLGGCLNQQNTVFILLSATPLICVWNIS